MYTLYNCKNLLESTGTVLVIIFSVVTIFLNYTKRNFRQSYILANVDTYDFGGCLHH